MTQGLTTIDHEFLRPPRIGVLITTGKASRPVGVPVWFHWTGTAVEMFTSRDSGKVSRLRSQPRASLLVSNQVGEPEHWVAFDGTVEIGSAGGFDLAERLAGCYWDLSDPDRATELAAWRAHRDAFCLLTLTPTRIRTGS